jgi:hypothetical protein
MRTTIRRVAALVAAPALSITLAAGITPASADPTPTGSSATTWLAGELTNGLVYNPNFGGFNDYGLSVDTALAELAMNNTAVAHQIRDAIAANVNSYITDPNDPGSKYAGATAKTLVLAQRAGGNPTSFGGVDLVTRLESLVSASGRTGDVSSYGDFANSIGQSFAAEGLARAGSPKASAVSSYLLRQQCPAGFFRLSLGDQQCADNSAPDTDVTALAVLGLQGLRGNAAVATAIDKAVAWLKTTQATDGSFGGGGVTAAPNTNSTGLAASALGASCEVSAATKAASYVRTFQVPAGQTGPLASEVGAIAYDTAGKSAGQTNGITDATSDQWRRATAQAAPALSWDSAVAPTVSISGPGAFAKGGSRIYAEIKGAAEGERFCLSDGTKTIALTGIDGPLTVPVDLPKRTGKVTLSATTGPGAAILDVAVLGKDKLKVALPKTVGQGDRTSVRLKGLAAKERVKLYVDGKLVGKGKANRKGVFVGRFVASFALGVHKLKAVGQFKTRSVGASFRVVR